MYETFEHTADLGLRVRAPDLNTLYAQAAEALFSVLVEGLDDVQPVQRFAFRLESPTLEDLLCDWLNELLYRFSVEGVLLRRFEVRVTGTSLEADAWGELIDPARHRLIYEVKAVTYHGLKVERAGDGWVAEMILDI